MNTLHWDLDEATEYWATRWTIPLRSTHPVPQYDGLDYRMREATWVKHLNKERFPAYCRYPGEPGALLASPANIMQCFQERLVLEGLALTVAWGRLTRAKGKIYQKSNRKIKQVLLASLASIEREKGVQEAWKRVVRELDWGYVAASKCIHFMARSLGYERNPPVPIDKTVFLNEVWPAFKKAIGKQRGASSRPMPKGWWEADSSWEAYNRYMTAMICWAGAKGWTTTQVENTVFEEYYPRNSGKWKGGSGLKDSEKG